MTTKKVDELEGKGDDPNKVTASEGEAGAGDGDDLGSGDGREVSPEELELQNAEKDLEAGDGKPKPGDGDEAAKPGEAGETPDHARVAGKADEAAPAADGKEGNGEPKVVPIAVVKKLRTDLSRSRHREAQLEGANATLQVMLRDGVKLPEGATPDTPTPTPQDKLADVKRRKLDLASKFDAGDITETQKETERQRLEDEEWEIRESMRTPATQAPVKDLGLEEHAVKLEEQYPILLELTEVQLSPLKAIAYAQAEREGKPIQPGPLGTKDLRERMAKLAQANYGTGPTPVTTTSELTDPKKPAGLSRTAQAREAKADLAENLPPDAGKLGSAAPAGGTTEAELETALDRGTEEEQIALLERHRSGSQGYGGN